jgi:hypothetical protein
VDDFKAFSRHPYLVLSDKLPADLYQRQATVAAVQDQLVLMSPLAWQPLQGKVLLQLKVQSAQKVKQVTVQAQGKSWPLQQQKWYWQAELPADALSFKTLPVQLEFIAELESGERLTEQLPVLGAQSPPDAALLFDPNWSRGFSERLRQLISGTGDGVTIHALCQANAACLLQGFYTLHAGGHTGLRYMPQQAVSLATGQQLSFYLQPDLQTQSLAFELASGDKKFYYTLDVSQWPAESKLLRQGRQVQLALDKFCVEQQCFSAGALQQLAVFIHAKAPQGKAQSVKGEIRLGAIQVQALTP